MKIHALVVSLAARVAAAQLQDLSPPDSRGPQEVNNIALTTVENAAAAVTATQTTSVERPVFVMTFVVPEEPAQEVPAIKTNRDGWWLLLLSLPVMVWRRRR